MPALMFIIIKTGIPGENHRPVASHWQTLSHNVVSSTPVMSRIWTHNLIVIGTDCIGSCKSNYLKITAMINDYISEVTADLC
jgi:hypothetical protein